MMIDVSHMSVLSTDLETGSIPDSFGPRLHLTRLKYTDGGEYFCVARNPLGTERSKPFLLNVTCTCSLNSLLRFGSSTVIV